MAAGANSNFISQDGQRGTVQFSASPQNSRADLRLENGVRFQVPSNLLQKQEDGSFFLPLSLDNLKNMEDNGERLLVLPVIQEELTVERRQVETGRVKITKRVQEHQEEVDEPIITEQAEIERFPVNRPVDEPPAAHYDGDTLIIPVVEEVLVVEKRLMLREEIHIRKVRTETHQPQQVTLRKEEVFIDHYDRDEE